MLTKNDLKRKNFTPEEFFVSDIAYRLNNDKNPLNDIKNYPDAEEEQEVLSNLMVIADLMQEVRDLLGFPIKINSAYRCKKLNDLVGSTDRSQHLKGQAVDFVCPRFGTPQDIFLTLKNNNIIVDQCLLENTWIHLSIKSNNNRNQFAKLINGIFTR